VRGYERIPGHDKLHKMGGSMNTWEECVRPRAGKDQVWISYNVMMSIYPGSPKYILPVAGSISVVPVSVCLYIEKLRYYIPHHYVGNVVTVTKTSMIHELPCGCGTLRTTTVRIWHQVSHRAAQSSRLLSMSPAELLSGLSCSQSFPEILTEVS